MTTSPRARPISLLRPGLEERFRHFEAICLPGLKAQSDPEFTFLVLVGTSLPAEARARLEALLADFPQARIVARRRGRTARSVRR